MNRRTSSAVKVTARGPSRKPSVSVTPPGPASESGEGSTSTVTPWLDEVVSVTVKEASFGARKPRSRSRKPDRSRPTLTAATLEVEQPRQIGKTNLRLALSAGRDARWFVFSARCSAAQTISTVYDSGELQIAVVTPRVRFGSSRAEAEAFDRTRRTPSRRPKGYLRRHRRERGQHLFSWSGCARRRSGSAGQAGATSCRPASSYASGCGTHAAVSTTDSALC